MQATKAASLPASLGFRSGTSSVHTSRTMMLDELSLVLASVAPNATAEAYTSAIVDENILGKRTQTTRQRSAKRLVELYALDPACTVFRLLRHFWPADQAGQPMLAFLAAATRDPLLREATPFVLSVPPKAAVNATQIGEHLNQKYPARFRPPGIDNFIAGKEYNHGGLSLQECVIPQLSVQAGSQQQVSARIDSFKWAGLRCKVKVEGQFEGCKADLRDKAADPTTSLAEEARTVGKDGTVSLVVKPEKDSREGTASMLVLLDPAGNVLEKMPVTVGA